MLKVLCNILRDLDPKVKVIGQKAGICDGVPSTSALACFVKSKRNLLTQSEYCSIWDFELTKNGCV